MNFQVPSECTLNHIAEALGAGAHGIMGLFSTTSCNIQNHRSLAIGNSCPKLSGCEGACVMLGGGEAFEYNPKP